ncbi:pyridoxal phosphate-dependent transferase [Tanacetum coccineum]|uniref:Pyridoxal phosphate-dependent transferase n=1 Tax=Tanacetum coccineum TaxID=301880 RepID=A0ABQ5AKK6_9ASTR
MHLSLWNPLSQCVALIMDKKTKKKNESDHKAIEEACKDGSFVTYQETDSETVARSWSLERLEAQNQFLKATFESEDSIPDFHQSYSNFLIMYPKYRSTEKIDDIRSDEYSHLSDHVPKVCLDYCGFGLFSFMQTVHYWESCTFNLTEITANLTNHALYGGASKGTMEHDIKTRIMDYMNIPENEYEIVFTVSRGYAFKLLAESYPFHTNKKLLTMIDHESQSVNWMAQCANTKGAKVQNAWFKWPTIDLNSTDLRKQIASKKRKKKNSGMGLFVFPVQSRVTGAKYSYQWMSLAQQNNWHVLLDAGALGPKDMDSLGLSLFRPEFIITSFYKVFGYDPTGFGCLLIKKSVIKSLENQPGHTGSGIVKISPVFPLYLSDSFDANDVVPENDPGPRLPAFSGAYTSDQVREVFDSEMVDYKDTEFEESGSLAADDVMKSPVFSEDELSDNSLWIALGRSPSGSDNGDSSTSSGPPFWFTSRNKIKHVSSPKPASKITNNPTNVSLDDGNGCEIEEVHETSETRPNLESAIRRETEGEFRLLGRREVNIIATNVEDDDYMSDDMYSSSRQEQEISCRHLDHVNELGLNKTTFRLRFLVNWLVTSLLQLKIRSNEQDTMPLVHIYGPKVKLERGGSMAFNLRDKNKQFINPEVVQNLAEKNGIFLGIGILSHIRTENEGDGGKNRVVRVEVVTASLGFLTNFSDVYKLWSFVAKFINPSFIKGGLSTVVEDE